MAENKFSERKKLFSWTTLSVLEFDTCYVFLIAVCQLGI